MWALAPFDYEATAWLPAANNRGELEFNFPTGVGSRFSKPRMRGIGRPTRTALSEIPFSGSAPTRARRLRRKGSRLVVAAKSPFTKSAIKNRPHRNTCRTKESTFASDNEESHVDQIIARQIQTSPYCRAGSNERCTAGIGPGLGLPWESDA